MDMKLFKRASASTKADDRAYSESVNDRMRIVLGRETQHDDAETVENRLRNMVYGTNKE
jgi:hypothetical protein